MDMEQYEEAVRDYEKVYQTEKTSGTFYQTTQYILCFQVFHSHMVSLSILIFLPSFRPQAAAEEGAAGVEEE